MEKIGKTRFVPAKKKKKNDVTSEGRQKIEVEQMWAIKTNRKQRTT